MLVTETVSVTSAHNAPEAGGQSSGSVLVTSRVRHRYDGVLYAPGETYPMAADRVAANVARGLIADPTIVPIDWYQLPDRELRVEALTDAPWPRVVACLNVWNDRPALERTMSTWLPYVDHVIAVDGAYASTGATTGPSTDGTLDYLREVCGDRLTLIEAPEGKPWADQLTKRNQYLLDDGSLLFVVDADEFVGNGEALRSVPACDVAWITATSPLYARPFGAPRLFRAAPGLRYAGRHHWLYRGDDLLATHQYGGAGVEHRLVPLSLHNARGLGHDEARRAAKRAHLAVQRTREATAVAASPASDHQAGARSSLRVVQLTSYDAGMVGYRLHTALNTTTPHASVFARCARLNPFGGPSQYDPDTDPDLLRSAARQADVIHCHLDYRVLDALYTGQIDAAVVIHHHGTWYRTRPDLFNALDAERASLRLISNLELAQYGNHLHFLPNPMPTARLRRLRAAAPMRTDGILRIGHSPSSRTRKGTAQFLAAVQSLQDEGLPVEAVVIERQRLADALTAKASCDLFFDAFDLGIQCSGLEAGAMGIPVIAGDDYVRRAYVQQFGHCPYTFAADTRQLAQAIEQLVLDADYRAAEAQRVQQYVTTVHDEAAVALRYLDLLDDAMGWRSREAPRPETHDAPPVTIHVPASPARHMPPRPAAPKKVKPNRRRHR